MKISVLDETAGMTHEEFSGRIQAFRRHVSCSSFVRRFSTRALRKEPEWVCRKPNLARER